MTATHPDDEQLSAFLDGEDGDSTGTGDGSGGGVAGAVGRHVQTCAECRARLDHFRTAIAAVSTPVAPAEGWWTDAAIAAAVSTAPNLQHDVIPLDRRRRPLPSWALGAAAAVAAIVLAVPLLAGLGKGGESKKSTVAASATTVTSPTAAANDSDTVANGASSGTATASGAESDLGDVNDTSQLVARAKNDGATAPEGATTAPASKASTATTAKSPAAATAGALQSGASCQPQAAAALPSDTTYALAYRARLRWQGQPATVFGFQKSSQPELHLVVTADGSCQVLVTADA